MPHTMLRFPTVKARTGLSRSTIYLRISRGTFPAPVSLGGRAVGWIEAEVNAWLTARIAQRWPIAALLHEDRFVQQRWRTCARAAPSLIGRLLGVNWSFTSCVGPLSGCFCLASGTSSGRSWAASWGIVRASDDSCNNAVGCGGALFSLMRTPAEPRSPIAVLCVSNSQFSRCIQD